MKLKSKILIIAGSDSSGGAGIQADIKTATCLGAYAMTAITAVTVQNTNGVKSVVTIPAKEIYNQIIYTTNDIKPNAIKIGMLHSIQVINKVLKSLKKIKGDKGAKKLIRSNKSKVQLVKIKSKSILVDFDQLKDFPSTT